MNTVRAADTRRYETADHCWKYNHDFDWENKKIMDYEANTTTRKIKETIHSLSNNNHINGISYRLPHIWFLALKLKGGRLARWCAKWRIKLNPEKTKVITFSKSRFAIRAEPALSLYGNLLSYYPHIKFLGITFDNRMTFTKHFEETLEHCNQKSHHLRILVNKKWGPSPETILQIYKQCVRPILEYGIVSTITVSQKYKESRTLSLG